MYIVCDFLTLIAKRRQTEWEVSDEKSIENFVFIIKFSVRKGIQSIINPFQSNFFANHIPPPPPSLISFGWEGG
jgi:hypothetical protein